MEPVAFNPADVTAQVVITASRNGQIQFNLPNDTILALGLLSAGIQAAHEQAKVRHQEASRSIAIATALPRNRMRSE